MARKLLGTAASSDPDAVTKKVLDAAVADVEAGAGLSEDDIVAFLDDENSELRQALDALYEDGGSGGGGTWGTIVGDLADQTDLAAALDDKADADQLPTDATVGHLVTVGPDDTLEDAGVGPEDFATAAQGAKADTAVQALADLGITTTAAELNHTAGVTGPIQDQLDAKVPAARTVNGQALSADVTLTLDDVPEGTTNKAFTATDQAALASLQTGLAAKVDTVGTASRLYATDGSGAQTTVPYANSGTTSGTVVMRGTGGTITAGTPTATGHAATKGYVDTALEGKAAATHTHTVAALTDLSVSATELNQLAGVSSPVQTQLNGKQATLGFTPENVANRNEPNGYCGLDEAGRISPAQLPSYVDDVLEVDTFDDLDNPGEPGKIYITVDTNEVWRWSGSGYMQIVGSPGTTDEIAEGSTNRYFTAERAVAALGALTASDNQILQRKSGALTARTPAEFKTDLALVAADIGSGTFDAARIPGGTTGKAVLASATPEAALTALQPDLDNKIYGIIDFYATEETATFANKILSGATNTFTDISADALVDGATNKVFTTAEKTKLGTVATNADVTNAASVDAAGAVMNTDTSTAAMAFVLDEDDLASDSATKVPTQQSVKAYVDAHASAGGGMRVLYYSDDDGWPDRPDDDTPTLFLGGTEDTPPTDVDVHAGDVWIADGEVASALADLTDVVVGDPQPLDLLAYSGEAGWANTPREELGLAMQTVVTVATEDTEVEVDRHVLALTFDSEGFTLTLPAQPRVGARVKITNFLSAGPVHVAAGDGDLIATDLFDPVVLATNVVPKQHDSITLYYIQAPAEGDDGPEPGQWFVEDVILAPSTDPKVSVIETLVGGTTAQWNTSGGLEIARLHNPTQSSCTINLTTDPGATVPHGQRVTLEFYRAAGALTLSWPTQFLASGVAQLPTTVPAGKTVRVGVMYDAYVEKWVAMAADPVGY
ncbi:hypothetical protein SEA_PHRAPPUCCINO_174 [Mycobacterium phage Phrappuccino]|uniref:Minor tail protein n=1 Tax=Mycobacterium phage Phrappuccino TaxID=2591223 RepID=A0A514DE10_9CAUD|nr:peptidase [Mycobacterium phage Phrappuccino]QDH91849.1 hypothetical protein SEA_PHRAPPUCCINO_174 [Mycobacterium phage Phrappuccino]QIQ63290.1 hypothetical protein SEA_SETTECANDELA_174 [Mycobacterium phage Settecandela]